MVRMIQQRHIAGKFVARALQLKRAKSILKASSSQGDYFDHLKIISFDDIEIFDLVNPKISSIAQPIADIGHEAIELLIDFMEHKARHQIKKQEQ